MFIIIKDNNIINKYELNKSIDYKGIHIYLKDNKYYIDLKTGYYFDDNKKTKILEIDSYTIIRKDVLYNILLYVYESSDGINNYSLYENKPFIIANSSLANIECKDPYLKDFFLSYKNGHLESNCSILLNHHQYNGEALKQGDLIEYLGICIRYFDDFLYINKFNLDIKLLYYKTSYALIKYKDIKQIDNFYIPDNVYELNIDDIKKYEPIKKPTNLDYIKSMIPNLVMCISMGLMAYINYTNNLKNSDASILSYIVMPISMMITGIIVPLIFVVISNRKYIKQNLSNKNEYIKYLNEYEQELLSRINKHIESLNSHYFNLIDSKKTLFYATKKSIDFLTLSIGKVTKKVKISYELTSDSQINEKLLSIDTNANSINEYPLYLDLLENNIVTIVSKRADKEYYFKKSLLEICYKHHYNDVKVAIYSTRNSIFDDYYNLPHLFIDGKRLTLNSNQDLQILDQLKLDSPLLLFMHEKSEYIITNSNIRVIYFSCDINDLLKDSDVIVEYFNNSGYLYSKNNTKFTYIPEDINFLDYFSYIGKYTNINNKTNVINYNDIFNYNVYNDYIYDCHSLIASFAYDNDNLISFDLHESKQGPHGLIGGSTGSGKSELIISLLLSLALRYPPDYLNFILIDYKGGGIVESLSYNNIQIPHIIASLTNLNDYGLQRLIIALKNECKIRQILFKKLSNLSNLSIMNLDDYIDNYNNYNLQKLAHELIVIDEFAELKKNNPEQIKELISISRIGRSLGIHLILATQKPTGIIDDEIWSNSRFKIALKVFDEKDSLDIIKSKDAAYLTKPGSFYMLVDGGLIKGQAIYSKSDVYGNDPYRINLLDSSLEIIKTFKKDNINTISSASYYCKKILEKTKDYRINKLEFMPPLNKNRHKLTNGKCLCFGEIDDYLHSSRGLLAYDVRESLLVYSSRPNEINAILNALNEAGRQSIVLANEKYEGKYISDTITYDSSEDIEYLFNYLLSNKNNNLSLVIEDISSLLSYDETYIERIVKLIKRKDNINLSIICLTRNCQISYKLVSLFKNKIMINIMDNNDLTYFYSSKGEYKGKSYFNSDYPITFIPINLESLSKQKSILEKVVKVIPENVKAEIKDGKYLLGYNKLTRLPIYNNNIVVVSYNEYLLEIYKKSYHDIDTVLYKSSIRLDENQNLLWLGSGIFNQRIFITGLKDDLNDEEGILIINNKRTLIRSLYNA